MRTSLKHLLAIILFFLTCVLTLLIGLRIAPAEPPVSTFAKDAAAKQNYLKNYVRPETIKRSFHAAEDMWVDCVDVNRQPSMLTPDMAGKTIEQAPPHPATDNNVDRAFPDGSQFAQLDTELHVNELDEFGVVRHCGEGTIPIRRRTAKDLSRFETLQDMFFKGKRHPLNPKLELPSPLYYEHVGLEQDVTNWGLQFFMNIWNPTTKSTDHSISQMWIANSAYTDTAEAGWTVDFSQFGDYKTHFFIYWTDNGYDTSSGNKGCYNLDCAGFVQTNNSLTFGSAYTTSSLPGGTQQVVEVTWAKSSSTGNWWLFYNGQAIGYIPASKYTHGMQTQADLVQFGGEVSSPNNPPGGPHTTTQMGSGQFPSAGYGRAAFQSQVQYVNTNYNTIDVTPNKPIEDTYPSCYNYSTGYENSSTGTGVIGTQSTPQNGYFVFFGGPGYSPSCTTTPPNG